MNKKTYVTPLSSATFHIVLRQSLLGLSDPDDGIHYGGPGDDDDDPSSKRRNPADEGTSGWGNLW